MRNVRITTDGLNMYLRYNSLVLVGYLVLGIITNSMVYLLNNLFTVNI